MEKLAELKEKLKELSPEELEEFKTFITEVEKKEETAETEKTEETEPSEESKSEEKAADESSVAAEESAAPETTPEEEPKEEITEAQEQPKEEIKPEEALTEEPKGENEGVGNSQQEPESKLPNDDDDIPAMQKIAPASDEGLVDKGSITAETGETIPVDYEQIIEGLNAEIAALTAENASLKNKVEGAFGYSAKTTIPAKVNRLYDECEDVHIHK